MELNELSFHPVTSESLLLLALVCGGKQQVDTYDNM